MRVTQDVPEGWTLEQEADWQDLCVEVDTLEYEQYVTTGGLRDFDEWRERRFSSCELSACSDRHSLGTLAELTFRPVGTVDVWVPADLPFDPERFTRA